MTARYLAVGPTDIGRKVKLFLRSDRGDRTEISGFLSGWSDESNTIDVRLYSGKKQHICLSELVTANVPSPDLSTSEMLQLLEMLYPPTESKDVGNWKLRCSEHETNGTWASARVSGPPEISVERALAEVDSWYRLRNLEPRLQIPSPSGLESVLRRQGWIVDYSVNVLIAPLHYLVNLPRTNNIETRPIDTSDQPYAPPGTIVAELNQDGRIIGSGRGLVLQPTKKDCSAWLGLTSFTTDRHHRRAGIATSILATLAERGLSQGSEFAVLQVHRNSRAALALYGASGFQLHHTYRYWIPSRILESPPGSKRKAPGVRRMEPT
jgi:N-acetylglutamate synthase